MNFLAHLYLSKNNTSIIIGNYIADHIKGSEISQFPKKIQQGILLHRNIDTFTDTHKIVRQSKRRLHKRYGHYDGVIIDIFYDYFLAKNWDKYSAIPLKIYSQSIYKLLKKNKAFLPNKSKEFLKYMMQYDLLYHYSSLEGIQKVLIGMNHRTKKKSQMHLAIEDLQLLHKELEADFTIFFESLREFCDKKLKEIL